MFEVYRDRDSAKVGLFNGLLQENGIRTMLRNWHASNIIEIPIPYLFPNICVFSKEDCIAAKEIIESYKNDDRGSLEEWVCQTCSETNEGGFSECWKCQTPIEE